MIDIETLGVKRNAPILTIAAVVFDPFTDKIGERFYQKIIVKEYDRREYQSYFSVDYSTLLWWHNQTVNVQNEAFFGSRVTLQTAIRQFNEYLIRVSKNGVLFPWSHGKEFDLPILEYAFNVLETPVPWKFVNTRDTRTVYSIFNINLETIDQVEFEKHHALGDCLKQIKGIQLALHKI